MIFGTNLGEKSNIPLKNNSMDRTSEKHIFSLIWHKPEHPLSLFKPKGSLTIDDPDLYHRIQSILRLKEHNQFILFDQKNHIDVEITAISKKQIIVMVQETNRNKIYLPEIVCAMPLLKRESLESSMDTLTQLGASTIQLITTKKMHRSSLGSKEFERLQRIIWASAEQSKNFAFPTLNQPLPLETLLKPVDQKKNFTIFFDPQGEPASTLVAKIKSDTYTKLLLIIGPEGDLTQEEKKLLIHHNVTFAALTPTILRAEQAAALGLGLLRSIL